MCAFNSRIQLSQLQIAFEVSFLLCCLPVNKCLATFALQVLMLYSDLLLDKSEQPFKLCVNVACLQTTTMWTAQWNANDVTHRTPLRGSERGGSRWSSASCSSIKEAASKCVSDKLETTCHPKYELSRKLESQEKPQNHLWCNQSCRADVFSFSPPKLYVSLKFFQSPLTLINCKPHNHHFSLHIQAHHVS